MKTMNCRDAGYDCDFVFRGQSKQDVMNQAFRHGRHMHGLKDITIETRSKIENLIHEEGPSD